MRKINRLPKNAHFAFSDVFGRKIYNTARMRYTVISEGLNAGVYSERYED